jgi:hypothetical protein
MWAFNDPPNVAVISTRSIVFGHDWIAYVSHDEDDGAWQFLPSGSGPLKESDAVVVSLQKIVNLDRSIQDLADLPRGWRAWRSEKAEPWCRANPR